ncbi:hypothetical protein [Paenibacillus xerothermodurans]|uniref:Uncharacterized protein n=1 Tax=Paenibacillus xerothermodurans TaxID=1977292 RepID=A0A2W1NDL6_PAEXE|nr:hypothetical protein [Paenibacillus xerothermodurans]PZE22607.1 hypothetical protein CBW46_002210 [Paenibacillus xerothermodurans]
MNMKKNAPCVVLLAAALTWSSVVPAFAAGSVPATPPASPPTPSTPVTPPPTTEPPDDGARPSDALTIGTGPALGQVKVNGDSYFELKNVTMLAEQKGKTVTFTVSVRNESSTDLLFIDYWVRLRTKSGNEITVRLMPQDQEKNKITAKSVEDINFYASVNGTTELTDLVFEFIEWDFSQPNFERKIGEVAVPADYTIVTPANDSHVIDMVGTEVKTSVKKVFTTKNDENYSPTVVLNMENVGNRAAAVPAYQYLLRTNEGYMYPLDAKKDKELVINPQVNEEIELSGSVPVTVSTEGWQLIIVQEAAEPKINIPIAYFQLPALSDLGEVATGVEHNFSNEDGTYTARLNSFQRVPFEDQDILNANITLINKGSEALPIPELTGYYMLDDAVKVEAQLIKTDKTIGLAKGAEASFQFVGKMPYTYQFSTVKLVLEEKTGEDETEELLEFAQSSELLGIPYMNVGEIYKVSSLGRNASYSVRSVTTYPGDTVDIFTVQMDATNLEQRFSDVSKLVAQLKAPDGTVYPATIAEIKNKVSPDATALLFLSTTLPKGLPTTNMNVMIGEAVTEDRYTGAEDKPDAYVNAAAFWLPAEDTTVKDNLLDVDLLPYSISINRINTWLSKDQLKLTFDYELKKQLFSEANMEGRKLVIGFEDEMGNKSFTREFDFKDFEAPDATESDVQSDENINKLRLGKHVAVKLIESDQDLIFNMETLKTYKVSIYDSFQGQKKLLASKKIDWFSTTD